MVKVRFEQRITNKEISATEYRSISLPRFVDNVALAVMNSSAKIIYASAHLYFMITHLCTNQCAVIIVTIALSVEVKSQYMLHYHVT